jgi:hypothetical protein
MGSIARMELTPIGRLDSVTMRDVAKALGDVCLMRTVNQQEAATFDVRQSVR